MGRSSKRSKQAQPSESDVEEEERYMGSEDELPSTEEEEMKDEEEGEEEEEEEEDENEKGFGAKDDEMEELEKEYNELRHQEQSILNNLKRYKDEDHLKGEAVKNQRTLWDKTLELRFLLQKAFSSSNRLPMDPQRSSFCKLDDGANAAYSNLVSSSVKALDSLLELQKALLEKNSSITQDSKGNSKQTTNQADVEKSGNLDEAWLRVSEMHSRVAPYRDRAVDKWHRKTQVTTGAAAIKGKLHAFNQNISEQVAAYMRDPSRMIKSMQQRRSMVGVFGADPEVMGSTKDEEMKVEGDPDLVDDSEFYQQLLKEFFETVDPSSSETAFYTLKRLQTKKRKVVDRRASKSRKIRYHVHEKIVNFMAPQLTKLPPMATTLFENVFGLKTQNPAATVQ